MRKIVLLLLLLPVLVKAQYKPIGNTLTMTPDKKSIRLDVGHAFPGTSPYYFFPQKFQLDSGLATKQPTGNYITQLHGDGTATGPGNVVFTLVNINSNVGTFGTSSNVSTIVANAKGQITGVVNTPILIAESQVTSLVSDLSNITTNYANRSASQTFTGIPTFSNGITTSATSNYNYPSTGNYYTSGGNQFALSGGGIAWQGGASIQNAGSGTAIIYNNGASGHVFEVGATPYLQIYSTGSGPAVGHILGSVDFVDSISVTPLHLIGYGTAPSFVVNTAAGTGATVTTITPSTDLDGVIIITTGTSTGTGIIVTGTFTKGYATNPKILIGAGEGSLATAQLQATANGLYAIPATTTFTLNTMGTALAASTVYKFAYHIMQ